MANHDQDVEALCGWLILLSVLATPFLLVYLSIGKII